MSTKPTVLLTGGTGKVASAILTFLKKDDRSVILASRSGTVALGATGCHFDWDDSTTYHNPFDLAHDIKSVFLVAPPSLNPSPPMKTFIDLAILKGVDRFVLLSASPMESGGPAMGMVQQYLESLSGIGYAVLRPTWFMDNLWIDNTRLDVKRGELFSATGDGRLPWVAVEDVGAVGYHALTDEKPHNTDHIVVGSELLSYQDVAKVLTEVTEEKITHVDLRPEYFIAHLKLHGISEDYASMLAMLEGLIKAGGEERENDVIQKITGRPPKTLRQYATENKARLEALK